METTIKSEKLTNYSKSVKAVGRRKRVIILLENQLKSGVKNTYERIGNHFVEGMKGIGVNTQEPLSESDIKRINKELSILKSRI